MGVKKVFEDTDYVCFRQQLLNEQNSDDASHVLCRGELIYRSEELIYRSEGQQKNGLCARLDWSVLIEDTPLPLPYEKVVHGCTALTKLANFGAYGMNTI